MTYPGGKGGSGVWQRIINQMPPHKTYVEAFLGGGSVLLAKRPAVASIGIDADAAVIEAWRSSPATTPNMTLVHGDGIAYLDANHT
jgi:site-specific DNA-adenine methylase